MVDQQKRILQLIYVCSFLTLSASIVVSHSTGRLYFSIAVGLLITTILLLAPTISGLSKKYAGIHLAMIVVFAVAYRTYIFTFPPGMIGNDPPTYAQWAQGLINTGFVDVISSEIYQQMPLSVVLSSMTGLVTDFAAPSAMVIYPLIGGIVFPLAGYLIARRAWENKSVEIAITAAIIASVAKVSLTLSYLPLAQTAGVWVWCILLVSFFSYLNSTDDRYFIVILLLFFFLLFTHRLPPTYIVAVFVSFVVWLAVADIIISEKSMSKINNLFVLALLLILALYLQYISTRIFSSIIYRGLNLLDPAMRESTALYQSPTSYTSAVPVQDQLQDIFLRRAHGFILLIGSGIAWLLVIYRKRDKPIILLLTIAAVTAIFMTLSLVNPWLGGIQRQLFMGEPILAALVAIGFLRVLPYLGSKIENHISLRKVGILLIVIIISAQITSVAATLPDRPGSNSAYLTQAETDGKIFACEYTASTVAADRYYATTPPVSFIEQNKKDCTRPFDNPGFLFNSDLSLLNSNPVLIRSKTVYATSNGYYQIRWNPKSELSDQSNLVYANGETSLFMT